MGGIKIISVVTAMGGTDGVVRTRMRESGCLVSISRTHGVIFGKCFNVCKPAFTVRSPHKVVRD